MWFLLSVVFAWQLKAMRFKDSQQFIEISHSTQLSPARSLT